MLNWWINPSSKHLNTNCRFEPLKPILRIECWLNDFKGLTNQEKSTNAKKFWENQNTLVLFVHKWGETTVCDKSDIATLLTDVG